MRSMQTQPFLLESHNAQRLPLVLLLGCVERLFIDRLATTRGTHLSHVMSHSRDRTSGYTSIEQLERRAQEFRHGPI